MKITREIHFQRLAAGYFEPPENRFMCSRCGRSMKKGVSERTSPWFCRLHRFHVRRDGLCPDFTSDPWNPLPSQDDLGPIFGGINL